MKNQVFSVFSLALWLSLSSLSSAAEREAKKPEVREGFRYLVVKVEAPIPLEITNDSQRQTLAKEAAVTQGQNQLLSYILQKEARSGKTLAVAEIPSLELQAEIREYVKKAEPQDVVYSFNTCRLTLMLSKGRLKSLLKRN